MEGNFLRKRFMSSGTKSGIFCVDGIETNSSTMGETLVEAVQRWLGLSLYKQTVLVCSLEQQ
jgi:hypothetical protein